MPLDEYLFSIPGIEAAPDAPVMKVAPKPAAPVDPGPAAPAPATTPVFFAIGQTVRSAPNLSHDIEPSKVVDVGIGSDGLSVALEGGAVYHQDDLVLVPTSAPEVASTQDSEILDQYASKSREELFALIEERGLDKPHHSTGAAKLVLILEADDAEGAHHETVEELRQESPTA